jgi:hypothetical protein
MSISVSQIGWSNYLQYEGPFFGGSQKYVEPADPTWEDKILSTITSTEGGRWDAYNGYDRMISTSGLIQWGEAGQYSVSDMLGVAAGRGLSAISELNAALSAANAEFKKNAKGNWRFFFKDERGEVDRLQEQQQLFLLRSDGLKGNWDDESKAYAKVWAAGISSVWTHQDAIQAQRDFTVPRLMWFLTGAAKATLFGPGTPQDNDGWNGALRAGYLSFAANLPAVAAKQLAIAVQATKAPAFSPDWCVAVLQQLTFGPQIAIYPRRYNAIRPTLERLFGVDLPDFAAELQTWKSQVLTPPTDPVPSGLTLADFDTVEEYQRELIAEGYDLGPDGADGVMGRLTKAAIVQFQQVHGLTADGIVGPNTRNAFLAEAIKRAG